MEVVLATSVVIIIFVPLCLFLIRGIIHKSSVIKSIMEYDLNMYIIFDKNGIIKDFNRTCQLWFYNYFDVNLEKKINYESVFKGYILDEMKIIIGELAIKEPVTFDKQFVTIFGEFLYVNFSFIPIYSGKKIFEYLFIGKDISKQKNAELNSKALALIPEEYPEPVLRIDYNGIAIYSNTEGRRFVDKNGLLKEGLKDSVLNCYGTGKSGEFLYKDKTLFEERVYLVIYKDIVDSSYINIYGVDITTRYESEINIKSQYNELIYDLDKASNIVENILPKWGTNYLDYYFFLNYEPSKKVGGDIVDILKISNDKLLVYLGDVSGHGVQAAIVMTAVKSIIKMILSNYKNKDNIDLAKFLTEINKVLSYEILKKNYLTLILGIMDLKDNSFKYINCGHPSIIKYDREKNNIEDVREKVTIPIGWDKNYNYSQDNINNICINKNDSLILYTDGVLSYSLFKSDTMTEDLSKLLLECKNDNIFLMPYLLKEKIVEKYKDEFEDDYTILTINHYIQDNNNYKVYLINNNINLVSNIGTDIYYFIFHRNKNNEIAFKAELLLNEYLNNLIMYGGKTFQIFIEIVVFDKDNILISFFDDSEKWDFEYNIENLDIDTINTNLSSNGRGLHIIKQISKRIERKVSNSINITKFYL